MMFAQYPKMMVHPNHRNAVLGHNYREGSPDVFPPVTVNNEDQEEQYRAKGYVSKGGNADPGNPKPRGYEFHEYPKFVNGVIVKSPAEEKRAVPVTVIDAQPVARKRGRPRKVAS